MFATDFFADLADDVRMFQHPRFVMTPTFISRNLTEMIDTAMDPVPLPAGVTIRPARWDTDLAAVAALSCAPDDSIIPQWNMIPETEPGLTLIAEIDGVVVGQSSVGIESYGTHFSEIELDFNGRFVDARHRGRGIGEALGDCVLAIAEAWRRQIAADRGLSVEGGISVSADTISGSAAERLIRRLSEKADVLAEAAEAEAYSDDMAMSP